jgi:predicted O-linked N-acetylglucosamine transferase (SPINDLY family)
MSDAAVASNDLGNRLRSEGRPSEAIRWYRSALAAAPERAEIHSNLGAALLDLGQWADARRALERALELDPRLTLARSNLATVLRATREDVAALQEFRRVAREAPHFLYARVHALTLARELADWEGWLEDLQGLQATAPAPGNTAPQLDLLYLPLSSLQLKAHAVAYATEVWGRMASLSRRPRIERSFSRRLRIGYVSDELRRHATGTLLTEALELHDRQRFEVSVYCWGADDGSVTERRVRRCCAMRDISQLSDAAAAERVRNDRIDILIDLKGYVPRGRMGLFALRPAPVQVSWLGYPGTLGTAFHDYIIADPVVIPPGAEAAYTENVARLPRCYQPNDRRRPMAAARARGAHGLPDDTLVFCHLGKSSKVLPDVFSAWMALLRRVPDSVLWLLAERDAVREPLRQAARREGVDPARLRFAGLAPLDEHIARFRVADLALDTFPYGSHTTASEALWAGCPLVTRTGDTFASRVAASLLHAAGMPELVTDSAEAYGELAVSLAGDGTRLAALRTRLETSRTTSALFDTPRLVRDLEALYVEMSRRASSGVPPGAIGAT